MTTTTISPVRQRMIEDMSLRNLAPRTQEAYIRGCKKLAAFLRRSPETATAARGRQRWSLPKCWKSAPIIYARLATKTRLSACDRPNFYSATRHRWYWPPLAPLAAPSTDMTS